MDAIELSSKLIKFKSITPQSSGSLEYIQEILKKSNFQCHLLEFGKDKIKNLYASFKGGEGPILCFAGHTDVVPPGDIKKWNSNPFEATSRNGKLYGRGASDMKTAIASFIVATATVPLVTDVISAKPAFILTFIPICPFGKLASTHV